MQQENDRYTQQIQGLKSDQKAIEKEAREQLGYAKPGEYVYVPPAAGETCARPRITPRKNSARFVFLSVQLLSTDSCRRADNLRCALWYISVASFHNRAGIGCS